MRLGAFRPQTTTEDKKVTNSGRTRISYFAALTGATYVVLPKENHMQLTEAATLDRKFGEAEGSASTDPSWRCFVRTSGEIRGLLIRKTVYSSAFISPRSLSMGVMLVSLPSQARYIAAGSCVFPRESTMCRRRSPLALVKPPLSRNH
jgi:hypothetical protein